MTKVEQAMQAIKEIGYTKAISAAVVYTVGFLTIAKWLYQAVRAIIHWV